ncbi:hypothetical protein M0M42_04260 [Pseudomonas knackmussii]|uniref:Uncharacterized protein n=1 Tax=Pseudomonas knackmussii TaxID=65741 RepID=A0ABY4KSG1_9PSED|nr:hypothetical protein [Pseudomonas knackmussii]UPQ83629.1 hypothetical protein M0M42_04260 [Pseudomonas knackmussii]
MCEEFFRVTAERISNPKGYIKFSLQLDGTVWASKLAPLKDYEKRNDAIYQFFISNGSQLSSLVGKYVYLILEETEYGLSIKHAMSLDILKDFKILLVKHEGAAFETRLPIYEFLKSTSRPLNEDGSITLNEPYRNLDINLSAGNTICYRNDLNEGFVTRGNIALLFEHLYKNAVDINNNPDREESVFLGRISIQRHIVRYHKNKGGIESNAYSDILKLGNKLSPEQQALLSKLSSDEVS